MNRESILKKLREKVARGEAIVGGGAGYWHQREVRRSWWDRLDRNL